MFKNYYITILNGETRKNQKLNRFGENLLNVSHKYPCVRIARLAVDKTFERRGIGRFLMLAAIGMAIDVSSMIGCRYITVDSKTESVVFYEKQPCP